VTARPPAASYQQDFPGRADQLSQVRREIAGYLGSCPAAADLVLIADELAANAIVHSPVPGQHLHRPLPDLRADRPDRGRGPRRSLAAAPQPR
jgi:hypothetical protein